MGFYNGTALELLCKQVVIDNPDMAGLISPDSVVIHGPVSARNFGGRNTLANFVGVPGKGLAGKIDLYYDRINLLSFTNQKYLPVSVAGDAVTLEDAIPDINDALGLNLMADDFTSPKTVLSGGISPTNLSFAIKNTSPLYTGSLNVSWTRKPVGVYPNSGPGPQELRIGNEDLGYFGIVSAIDMPNGTQIANGVVAGTTITPPASGGTTVGWMKFFYKGKIVFIPKTNMAGVTWNDYYKAGSLYSQDDPNYLVNPGTDKVVVPQDKVFSYTDTKNRTFYFHHRLPRGSDVIDQKIGSNLLTFGEDYALVSRLNGGEWGTEPGIALFGNYWMSQHRIPGNDAWYIIFNFRGSGFMGMDKTSKYNYVPVLELVDPSQALIGVADFTVQYTMPNGPVFAVAEPAVNDLVPIAPITTAELLHTPPAVSVESTESIVPIVPAPTDSIRFTPAVATATIRTPNSKFPLDEADGELDTFN
ncbi:putative virion structural protein [Erwinia phage pEa_SNUABM_42]|nr:putative virion structural protein [Erwinia phage pEa_SNUABM_43]QVW55479.1 putative virion structural protein [Erwinia phage pEa_SNUABM_42]